MSVEAESFLKSCGWCKKEYQQLSRYQRHCSTHLPWYFSQYVCIVCQVKFDSKAKLLDHCESLKHQRTVKNAADPKMDIAQLRENFTCELTDRNQLEFVNSQKEKPHFSNYDRSDGIMDEFSLFPEQSASSGSLNTPELDSQREFTFDGTLSTFNFESEYTLGEPTTLPAPMKPFKRQRKEEHMDSPRPRDTDLNKVLQKLTAIETKLDAIPPKIVTTAESQSADLKIQFQRMEESLGIHTTTIQEYSQKLTAVLHQEVQRVLSTAKSLQKLQPNPPMSTTMQAALVTLSQEAVKLYSTPYEPK